MNVERRSKNHKNNTEISEKESSVLSKSDDSVDSLRNTKKFKPRHRQENSLGELTRNVINYIKNHGKKEINIK